MNQANKTRLYVLSVFVVVTIVSQIIAIKLGTWEYFSQFTQASAAWASGAVAYAYVYPWVKDNLEEANGL